MREPWGSSPTHLRGFGLRVCLYQEHLHGAVFLHGQRQSEVAERIEGHRHLGALRTHQRGLEEAVENINDDGVVA